jgi:tyrosyl-tRNA synthetase
LGISHVDELAAEHAKAPERRRGQRVLAREVTMLVHGAGAARAAEQASKILFGGSPFEADSDALAAVAAEVPTALLGSDEDLAAGTDLVPLLVDAELASSRGDARRALEQGAVSVNGERAQPGRVIVKGDLLHGRYVVLRKGKRSYAVLVWEAG